MKKIMKRTAALGMLFLCANCATVLGGPITEKQRKKPLPGELQREIRIVALLTDLVLFPPGVIIDFATGAIYKPH